MLDIQLLRTQIDTVAARLATRGMQLDTAAFQALEETPLHSVVQSAGMVWVATDSSKHQEAQSQIKAEPEILPMGRTPKAPVSLQNGPMVLVETGGQEKTV